jgi:site-specific recombinase XerD
MQKQELGREAEGRECSGKSYVSDWLDFLVAVRGRAPSTAKRYGELVVRMLDDCGLTDPRELTRGQLEGHLKRLFASGRGASVRQGVVVAARSLGEWMASRGLVEQNPAVGLRGPSTFRRQVRPLTVEEVERLIWGNRRGYLPRGQRELRDRALLAVMYIAGLRASEVGPIRLDDVQWDEALETFRLLLTKSKASHEERWVYLDRSVSRVLGTYLQARPAVSRLLFVSAKAGALSRFAVHQIFDRRRREAGIEPKGRKLSPHILRHSIATHLISRGVDLRTVQVHMRHSSIKTTEIYLHADESKVQRMLLRRSPLGPRGKRRPELQKALTELLGDLKQG